MNSQFLSRKVSGTFLVLTLFLSFGATAVWGAGAALSPLVGPSQSMAGNASAPPEVSEPQRITISEVKGQVFLKKQSGGDFKPVSKGSALQTGDTVKTEQGLCEISLENHTSLSVGPKTVLEITEATYDRLQKARLTRLSLPLGQLKAKIGKLGQASRFEVITPTAIASVRGTILFLNSGVNDQKFTELYVDETKGGVLLTNTASGTQFLIGEHQSSSSFQDGGQLAPRDLSEPERNQFIQNWENQNNQGISGQGNIEEENLPGEAAADLDLSEGSNEIDDAAEDKKSEQSILGASETAHESLAQDINLVEKRMIREEIARLRGDIDFERADANLVRISDAQTGKVFTDVFGNRVRTDQYIFHEPNSDTVQFLSLTARTGAYQNGVSAVRYGVQFNRSISADTDIHSLPWNDYMNVVTNHEVAANLKIPETIQGENGSRRNPDFDALYEQYIVHETSPSLAKGSSALFPVYFYVEFTNPKGDRSRADKIRFDEAYSNPFSLTLKKDLATSADFTAQGRKSESTLIQPQKGDKILRKFEHETHKEMISINDGNFVELIRNPNGDNKNGDGGSQTKSFADNFTPSRLSDINTYRNLPVNDDGNPDNDDHPMYFEDDFHDRIGAGETLLGRNQLIGVLIPIDDQGRVIHQPGFNAEGIRDLLSPNPLVSGGNYNLEIILMVGYRDNNGPKDLFHEDFRIDTIITPEIFKPFGAGNTGRSLFPASLRDDDDDHGIRNT